MATFSVELRNYYYLLEAERTGIHKPILAALYQAHHAPTCADGETGLGISPANRIALAQVNTFADQVYYAANVIRSLTDSLVAQGWVEADLWQASQGCYSDKFLETVAKGYAPDASQTTTPRLEACHLNQLQQAYQEDWSTDFKAANLPENLGDLSSKLLSFVEQVPNYYLGLPNQQEAMLEAVRIGQKLDTSEEAIAYLVKESPFAGTIRNPEALDIPLKQYIQSLVANYQGTPQTQSALLRLTQLWRQLNTQEEAIASLLSNTSAEAPTNALDPALISLIGQLPDAYQGRGSQRNALVESFRLWHQLDSRTAALLALGINAEQLEHSTTDKTALVNLATQLDRELLNFVRRLPTNYQANDQQREVLIRLVQLWHNITTRNQTLQFLIEQQKNLQQIASNSKQAFTKPLPIIPKRPSSWTPDNIQLFASIIEDGNFTWAEATTGGMWLPPDQATVEAIIRIAKLAQKARDRLGRPLMITNWYCPNNSYLAVTHPNAGRYQVGDALSFVCEGLTAKQLYWALDPWWVGGLGCSVKFPYLCHIDARSYRARWLN